jgi:hypothetical protein
MTGILERIEAKLDMILAQPGGALAPQAAAQPLQATQTFQQPQQPQNIVGGTTTALGAAGGYPPATQEMIVQLVTPLVNDPNVKAALQAEMHTMGITELPMAQPHQYPELYARFQGVAARITQPQQPAAAPASII